MNSLLTQEEQLQLALLGFTQYKHNTWRHQNVTVCVYRTTNGHVSYKSIAYDINNVGRLPESKWRKTKSIKRIINLIKKGSEARDL